MARSRFRMTGKDRFVARATAFSDNLSTLGAEAVTDAAEAGAEAMRERIETSGTGWKRRAGRIETGQMLADVGSDARARAGTTRVSGRTRSARFGWIKGMKDYYIYQERGFTNVMKNAENEGKTWGGTAYSGYGGPPGWTDAMGAYAEGFIVARERLVQNINGITRRAWYRR